MNRVEEKLSEKFKFTKVEETQIRKLEVLVVSDFSVEFSRITKANLILLFSSYFPNSTINLLYLFNSSLENTPRSQRAFLFLYDYRNTLMFKVVLKLKFNVFNCYISMSQYENNTLKVQIDFEIFNASEVNRAITIEERYQVNDFFAEAKKLVLNFLIHFPRLRFEQFSRGALDQGLNGDVLSVIGSFLGPIEEIVGRDINKNTSMRFQERPEITSKVSSNKKLKQSSLEGGSKSSSKSKNMSNKRIKNSKSIKKSKRIKKRYSKGIK